MFQVFVFLIAYSDPVETSGRWVGFLLPILLLFGDDQDKMKIMKSFDRNLVKTATAVEHRTWVGNRAVWRNTDNHAVICSADASMDPMSQFCPKFAEMLEFNSNQTLNFCCS